MCGCHGIGLRKLRADIVWVAAQWIMCQSLGRTIRKRWGNGDFWLGWFFFLPLTVQDVFFFQLQHWAIFFGYASYHLPARGEFALGLYAVIFLRLMGRSRESDSKVLTLMPAFGWPSPLYNLYFDSFLLICTSFVVRTRGIVCVVFFCLCCLPIDVSFGQL